MMAKDVEEKVSERLIEESNGIDEDLISRGHARRMGHLENYFALLNRQDMYGNFSTYCEYKFDINLVQLADVLRDIFLKNPILIHTIIPKNYPNHEEFYRSEEYLKKSWPEHDYIKIIPKLTMNDILINEQFEYTDLFNQILKQFKDDNDKISSKLTELIAKIRIPIAHPTRPNWRLLLLPSDEGERLRHVVFVSNHCASDAMSAVNLFQDIGQGLNKLQNDSNFKLDKFANHEDSFIIIDYSKDYENLNRIPVPITERIDYRPTWILLIKFIITVISMSFLRFQLPNSASTRLKEDEAQGKENYHYTITISTDKLTLLRKQVKENNASMTGFLQACFSIVLKEYGIFDKRPWNEIGFDVSIPNDNRRVLPQELVEEQYKYGANVAGSHYCFPIYRFNRNALWTLSKENTDVIRNADYNSGLGSLMMEMVYKNQNIDKTIADSYLGNSRGGIILSNVGLQGEKPNDEVPTGIQDLMFVQDVATLNFGMIINVCSTPASGMHVCISSIEDMLHDRENFTNVCESLEQLIDQYCH